MAKNKKGISADSIKSGLDTAIDITVKVGQILAAAATVITAAKNLKEANDGRATIGNQRN